MAKWVVVVSAEQFELERLYAQETFRSTDRLPAGDEALLVAAAQQPIVFGVARSDAAGLLRYTSKFIDEPMAAGGLAVGGPGARLLTDAAFAAVAGRIEPRHRVDSDKRTWLVSVDLPIEAATPAEAVRTFWSYVRELGPAELPALVRPTGDELSMQAFVLGAEANQDPEQD